MVNHNDNCGSVLPMSLSMTSIHGRETASRFSTRMQGWRSRLADPRAGFGGPAELDRCQAARRWDHSLPVISPIGMPRDNRCWKPNRQCRTWAATRLAASSLRNSPSNFMISPINRSMRYWRKMPSCLDVNSAMVFAIRLDQFIRFFSIDLV